MTSRTKMRVMVVDDSAVARQLLSAILNGTQDLEVVATVADGEAAVSRAKAVRPDLVTMDLQLPGLDGIEATRRIMRECPTTVVVVSSSDELAEERVFRALEAGAVAALERPMPPGHPLYLERRRQLLSEIRAIQRASQAPSRLTRSRQPQSEPPPKARRSPAALSAKRALPARRPEVIALAASTGGPIAVRRLLEDLPRGRLPAILIVQHITSGFVQGLAGWLSEVGPAPVRLAEEGEALAEGKILLAPDDRHLAITPERRVRLSADPPVGGHRPSATELFASVAEAYGPAALGLVLTGMGRDGAAGLARLHQAGGFTIAQDQATSVVSGMPDAAVALDAIDVVLPLPAMGAFVGKVLSEQERTR